VNDLASLLPTEAGDFGTQQRPCWAGGLAQVFLAFDDELQRNVAVKLALTTKSALDESGRSGGRFFYRPDMAS